LFGQTAAPTGWTKDTSNFNNSGLRIVTGTASSGGSVDFTTAFASQTPAGSVSITAVSGSAGATTLGTPAIPSHKHTSNVVPAGASSGNATFAQPGASLAAEIITPGSPILPTNTGTPAPNRTSVDSFIENTGGGGSHTHPFSFSSGSGTFSGNAINLAVKYVDVIRATKN
jgi:hypothetical protein